ncbi:MAG: FtsW/RodA/SpoVE family cell cycle protein [Oscillospiraceae bacterium]|nr:FtsW/RodA/SpoVE family cell cycle protein [Oscillospiraceae bacterium]
MVKKALKVVVDYIKHLDKILILLCLAASGFGILLLYSMSANDFADVSESYYKTQIYALAIGFVAMLTVAAIDYRFISKIWFIYAPAALILVFLLFTPLGLQANGADDIGWLNLGFVTIQPSELLKVAFIMTFATHLYKVDKNMNRLPHFILLCIHGLFPVGLISLQGDDGTAIVFLFMFVIMMLVAGLALRYIIAGCIAVPVGVYFVWNYIMQPHHKARILVLFDPEMQEAEIKGIWFQQFWGKVALGTGKMTGVGLFGGDYVYTSFIHNDFIFAYIGNALGFVGCICTVVLLLLICMKVYMNSVGSKNKMGKLICIGVFSMILIHSILNIGMVLAVLPVIGIPLPFISAGGTSTVALYASMGLVLSVYGHREKKYHMFYTEKD